MKKFEELGKRLSKSEQRSILGGTGDACDCGSPMIHNVEQWFAVKLFHRYPALEQHAILTIVYQGPKQGN